MPLNGPKTTTSSRRVFAMQASFAFGCGGLIETHPVDLQSLSELHEAVDIALSRRDVDAISCILLRTFPGAIAAGKLSDVKGFSGDHDLLVVHYGADCDEELNLRALGYARWRDGALCDDDPPPKRARLGELDELCSRSPSPLRVELYEAVEADDAQIQRRKALQSAMVELHGALVEPLVRADLALLREPLIVDSIESTPNSLETRLDLADVILCTSDALRERVVAHLREVAAGRGPLDLSVLHSTAANHGAQVFVEV